MHKPMPMHFHLRLLLLPSLICLLLLLLLLNNQTNQSIQPIHPSCRPTEEKEEARRAKRVFVVARTSPRPEENTPPSADPANNGLIIFEIFSNIPKIEFQNENN